MIYIIFKSDEQHMRTAARVCPRDPATGLSQPRILKEYHDGEPAQPGRRQWIRQRGDGWGGNSAIPSQKNYRSSTPQVFGCPRLGDLSF